MYVFLMVLLGYLVLNEIQTYSQNEYKLVLDHIESAGYNKTLLYYMYAKNTRFNRTYKTIEIGFRTKVDFSGDKLKGRIQGLQFFHNEYRRTPILFDVKVCEALEMNTFGVGTVLSENGNITKCPLRKGTYLIHDFNFDARKFPPHIPRGKWQVQLHLMQGDTKIGGINFYGSVEDILKY